ncbi:MAG: ABC transporter permease [Lysobacterales bacterium]
MNTLTPAGSWPRAYVLETWIECLKVWRQPAFLFPTLFFPALFYLLFGILMVPRAPGGDAARYLLATYATFGAIGPALFGFGVGLAEERSNGLFDLRRVSPAPPFAPLLAKAAMAMLFAATIALLLISLAVGIGGVRAAPSSFLALIVTLMLGTLPFAALGMGIGCLVRAQAASALVQLIYLPLGFLGGLWMPVFMLPTLMQSLAACLPSFHLGQLSLWALGVQPGLPTHSALAMLGFTAIFSLFAAWAWRRAR